MNSTRASTAGASGVPATGADEPAAERSVPATERVYAHVKERLLDGRLPGGALLSENDVAQRLGLSRTPVRQAFVQLQVEGLLELYPKRGALVVPVAASEIEDVFDARMLVEQHSARRAAGAGPALAAELRAAIEEQERAIASGGAGFVAADRRFHRAIVAAGGNAILTRLYDSLRDRQQRIAAIALARNPGNAATFIAEHREIAEALERDDADTACALLEAHLRVTRDVARGARA
jgi:DNA-binding GntR family transcriptional regulator